MLTDEQSFLLFPRQCSKDLRRMRKQTQTPAIRGHQHWQDVLSSPRIAFLISYSDQDFNTGTLTIANVDDII